ncbi:Glycosyl transferases group 1 [Streptococcus porcinus]|uniref:glycosyltransferase n=1 Tax=Streptococcus porcinus TaxID=1340 RepID=UPI0010CABEEF|nr:glycosyltransferase [Streptococcus porcinus]VTS24291.1 Glycosyl transferases group 1 [Streptococcus porcinus]
MKIFVLNTAARSKGALSVFEEFYNTVLEDSSDIEWIFLVSEQIVNSKNNVKVIVDKSLRSKFKRLKFDLFTGHRYIKKFSPDVIVSFQNTLPLFTTTKTVLYLHQSLPFQTEKEYSFFKRNEFPYAVIQYIIGSLIRLSVKRSDLTIVQSEWLKQAISTISKNTKVIAPTIKDIPKLNNQEISNQVCFFYPTSDYPYKNNELIEKAVEIVEQNFESFSVKITLEHKLKSERIESLGMISRTEVMSLMSQGVLLFPSYIESFGLPLLEARELNRIILSTDTLFAREVLQDYPNVYYFHKNNYEELAQLMERVIQGNITIKKEVVKSAKKNSWEVVKNSIVEVVR